MQSCPLCMGKHRNVAMRNMALVFSVTPEMTLHTIKNKQYWFQKENFLLIQLSIKQCKKHNVWFVPNIELFTHLETSPLPVMGYKI